MVFQLVVRCDRAYEGIGWAVNDGTGDIRYYVQVPHERGLAHMRDGFPDSVPVQKLGTGDVIHLPEFEVRPLQGRMAKITLSDSEPRCNESSLQMCLGLWCPFVSSSPCKKPQ